MQTGNGGAAGSIMHYSMSEPLMRGYAVANTDTGHRGGVGDFTWAAGHPEKLTDYAYRAVHELTLTGKAITTTRFGRSAEKSYWLGCSTGGRQGLMEAQRFPEDYDAIVAGAPASNWAPLMSLSIVIQNNLGAGGLGLDKVGLLKESAIAACDALDGVEDRVITNPARCDFDPGNLQCQTGRNEPCLSAEEVEAAGRIYAGVTDGNGRVWIPGTGPSSEPLWAGYASPEFEIGTSFFRNVVANDAEWKPSSFDMDTDLARVDQVAGSLVAMNPDISAFLERGGKLITYHGTTDGLIPYGNSLNYFESMVSTLGEETVNNSARYYQLPGMDHCFDGEGAWLVDWLGAIEQWVEEGRAPGALLATHLDAFPGATATGRAFTRPACPYPQEPTYSGSGNVDDAASYSCVPPRAAAY
jgi:feruloyl esterase